MGRWVENDLGLYEQLRETFVWCSAT